MDFWTVVLIVVIAIFVLSLVQYIYKKRSRICEYCNHWTWDGICPSCRAKLFPEEDSEKKP
jgi:hypothetical protein